MSKVRQIKKKLKISVKFRSQKWKWSSVLPTFCVTCREYGPVQRLQKRFHLVEKSGEDFHLDDYCATHEHLMLKKIWKKAVAKGPQEKMREILESRKNKKITNKAYLEQHLLNLNQEQLKFKKDVQGRNKDNPSVAFELLIINCQTYFKIFSSFNC